jgi:hypothetical protein
VVQEPFVPYAIAAVVLELEKMVVVGQVARGSDVSDLRAGLGMELVLDVVWKWRPAA